MPAVRLQLAAWRGVHDTRMAGAVLGTALVANLGLGAVSLRQLGPIAFLTPVSLSLLLPVVAGTAVAIACHCEAALPLPNPRRAQVARAGWLLAWSFLAVACTGTAVLRGNAMASPSAITRNTVLHATLAVAALVLGLSQLPWLPSVLLTLTAILFGADQAGTVETYRWWAVMLDPDASGRQLVAVGLLFVLAATAYARAGQRMEEVAGLRQPRPPTAFPDPQRSRRKAHGMGWYPRASCLDRREMAPKAPLAGARRGVAQPAARVASASPT